VRIRLPSRAVRQRPGLWAGAWVVGSVARTTIEELLAAARSRLFRVTAAQALQAMGSGAVLVDIRAESQIAREDTIAGALVIARKMGAPGEASEAATVAVASALSGGGSRGHLPAASSVIDYPACHAHPR
jgi:hypothetical protein